MATLRNTEVITQVIQVDSAGNPVGLSAGGASTATLSNVNDSASSVTLVAASARKGLIVYNDSTSDLYLKYGATASATSFTVKILAGGYWEMPQPMYVGLVAGIWSSDASGAARLTELT